MRIKELVEEYRIKAIDNYTKLQLVAAPSNTDLEEIKSSKAEILAFLKEEAEKAEKAIAERNAKIAAIEGLQEILDLKEQWSDYNDSFNHMVETGNSVCAQQPTTKVEDIIGNYPRARAYLMAKAYDNASNYEKSFAGKKALEKIINGEDYKMAIEEMQNTWDGHCTKHLFD